MVKRKEFIMKKFISAFMAIVMCAALAVPVFAEDPNRTLTYGVTTQTPTVSVTIDATGTVLLNPYQIKVTNNGLGAEDATGSVLAAKYYVKNKSDVPLKMSITATGAIPEGSAATFANAAPDATEKNRKVFLFVDVGAVTEGAAPTDPALCAATYDATKLYDATTKTGSQGVLKSGDLKLTDVLTITVPTDAANGNYVPIQIGGSCATTPTDAWTANDKVSVSMVFSFTPTVIAAATPAANNG